MNIHSAFRSKYQSMTKLEFSRRSDIDVIMPVNSLTDSEMSMVCDCSASLSITDTIGCWQNSAKTISLAVNWQLWTCCTISTLTCTLTLASPKCWTSFSTSIMTPRCYLISSETFLSLSLPNSLGINFCALCSLINTSCTFCRVRKIYRNSSSAKNSSAYWTSRATSTITRFNLWAYGNGCIYGTFMQLSDVCLKPDYTAAHYSRTVVALCYDNTTTKSQSCQRWQNGSRKRLCININHMLELKLSIIFVNSADWANVCNECLCFSAPFEKYLQNRQPLLQRSKHQLPSRILLAAMLINSFWISELWCIWHLKALLDTVSRNMHQRMTAATITVEENSHDSMILLSHDECLLKF